MVDPTVELDATKAALEALKPLDKDQAARALRWLSEILEVSPVPSAAGSSAPMSAIPYAATAFPPVSYGAASPPMSAVPYGSAMAPYAAGPAGDTSSPKAFLAWKRPKSGYEKIACLAFYLTHFRAMPRFKAPDISALNTEAAQPKMQNASRDVGDAERRTGFLASAGGGSKQISARGEAVVSALPDREMVEAAMRDHEVRRRKPSAKKASASNSSSVTSPSAANDAGSSASGLAKP